MTNDIRKMNEVELKQVAGGVDGYHGLDPHGPWKRVSGLQTGWLALRSDYKYNSGNEIGQLSAPESHGTHGSTPSGSTRADG